MAEDDDKGYRWETEYEKTWEELQEDESGSLQASVAEVLARAKRRTLLEKVTNVRLGMMRHLFVIIDLSEAMADQDLKPSRNIAVLKLMEFFVEEYFDQNPISQMGIIITKNKRAEKITELGGNPRRHIKALQDLASHQCRGELSLQNALELAHAQLKHMPGHASREVLVLMGSLTTCDPGDVRDAIKAMSDSSIRCSVIGLSAEVRVCKTLASMTNGSYSVILDETHLRDLLSQQVTPPPAHSAAASSLIKMGFPHHALSTVTQEECASMCMCHLDSNGSAGRGFSTTGYFCPQCKSKYCELPTECRACGLTLVSAPHLARSYHHLFPPQAFTETLVTDLEDREPGGPLLCYGCQAEVLDPHVYLCQRCGNAFCLDCDLRAHDTLHCCPGCACLRHLQTAH